MEVWLWETEVESTSEDLRQISEVAEVDAEQRLTGGEVVMVRGSGAGAGNMASDDGGRRIHHVSCSPGPTRSDIRGKTRGSRAVAEDDRRDGLEDDDVLDWILIQDSCNHSLQIENFLIHVEMM